LNWDPPICGTDKARHLKFGTCVDRGNYWRMEDKSPFRESAKVMWLTEWSKVKVKGQGQGRKIVFFSAVTLPHVSTALVADVRHTSVTSVFRSTRLPGVHAYVQLTTAI